MDRAESTGISAFERVMSTEAPFVSSPAAQVDIDPEGVKNGLAALVLTVVKLVHELLEKQALRRIDEGSLTDTEIERIGLALMKQSEEIERIRQVFGLDEKDLNLDLGPLGRLL